MTRKNNVEIVSLEELLAENDTKDFIEEESPEDIIQNVVGPSLRADNPKSDAATTTGISHGAFVGVTGDRTRLIQMRTTLESSRTPTNQSDDTQTLPIALPNTPDPIVKQQQKPKVEVVILRDEENSSRVHLSFKNISNKTIFLTKSQIGYKGEFDSNPFEIEPKIAYLGGQDWRKSTPEDLVTLEPQKEIITDWFDLVDLFALELVGSLKIRYSLTHPLTGKVRKTRIYSDWINLVENEDISTNATEYTDVHESIHEDNDDPPFHESQWQEADVLITSREDLPKTLPLPIMNPTPIKVADKRFWLILSSIFTGVAALGAIVWIIPSSLLALAGIIFAIISLKKKETSKGLTITSLVVASIILIYSLTVYVVILMIILLTMGLLFGAFV